MQSKCCKRETAARRCKRLLMRKKNQKRRLWILLRMNIKAIANAKKDEAKAASPFLMGSIKKENCIEISVCRTRSL